MTLPVICSPSGKLVQIEHALTAVGSGQTSLGIKGKSNFKIIFSNEHVKRFFYLKSKLWNIMVRIATWKVVSVAYFELLVYSYITNVYGSF